MSIKLFVSDIDGTLAISGKNPSPKNVEAVKKMQEAGIIVTIATGRMYRAAVPVAKAAGMNAPIISYNGALIKKMDGEVIYKNYLEPETVLELVNFFEEKNIHLQTYSDDILRYPKKINLPKHMNLHRKFPARQSIGTI